MKKIIALCLIVALAITAVTGATLAYFTDVAGDVENNFAIGDISIDLWEYTGDVDEETGAPIKNYGEEYTNLMPTSVMKKEPYVENTSKTNDAYVRVFVVMNNLSQINDAIDEVYESKGYTEEEIQAVYDEVFNGWGINHAKRNPDKNDRRMWMDNRSAPVLGNIDTFGKITANPGPNDANGMYDVENQFMSKIEFDRLGMDAEGFVYYDEKSYYDDAVKENERVYAFYLKLAPGEQYKLFDGLKVPDDFDNNITIGYVNDEPVIVDQMDMFDGLQISIYADAIQTEGFDEAVAAFNALEEANHLGWWNRT